MIHTSSSSKRKFTKKVVREIFIKGHENSFWDFFFFKCSWSLLEAEVTFVFLILGEMEMPHVILFG